MKWNRNEQIYTELNSKILNYWDWWGKIVFYFSSWSWRASKTKITLRQLIRSQILHSRLRLTTVSIIIRALHRDWRHVGIFPIRKSGWTQLCSHHAKLHDNDYDDSGKIARHRSFWVCAKALSLEIFSISLWF